MMKHHFGQVWNQLRAKKPHMAFFLEEVRIQGLRGIRDLKVRFTYPVSVLSGPNTCGKSTILFALASAYKVPGAKLRDFTPSALFPDFRPRDSEIPSDKRSQSSLEFYYIHENQRYQMRYSRGKTWNKSYLGQHGGSQPERVVYLRTVANLTNPSEVRSVLQLGRKQMNKAEITANYINFAQRILPLRYRHLFIISHGERDLLFAERDDLDGIAYSEFHMSAGEQAILRLSKDISLLHDALVLIDEIEAGLHPFTQQQLMLELQRLALRNNLQIVVTTHSQIILESVPSEGRIFLERTMDNVEVLPPYRDIIQKAFYGRSVNRLSILCEDEVAEALLRGVVDIFYSKFNFTNSDIGVGRDTGKDEFPHHVKAIANFNQLHDFIFVLDGDGHDMEAEMRKIASDFGQPLNLLFLPGSESPESWVWAHLNEYSDDYADKFKMTPEAFRGKLSAIEQTFSGASDKQRNIEKGRLISLSDDLVRDITEICRVVGCTEAERDKGDMGSFVTNLGDAIQSWRSQVE
ncbi:MAG: AAA family ATPase [Methanothrix sp.]|nr:AAA family ATPase [Methanothrix sp.]